MSLGYDPEWSFKVKTGNTEDAQHEKCEDELWNAILQLLTKKCYVILFLQLFVCCHLRIRTFITMAPRSGVWVIKSGPL